MIFKTLEILTAMPAQRAKRDGLNFFSPAIFGPHFGISKKRLRLQN
jgi:hypothetical protein